METDEVVYFQPYPFSVGQRLNITGGPRKGDWEVTGVSERKVKLRCPISLREFEWDKFCYFTEEKSNVKWPNKD